MMGRAAVIANVGGDSRRASGRIEQTHGLQLPLTLSPNRTGKLSLRCRCVQVSTVEHVASEAAAVQASLTAGVREELEKMTHDSHEAQVHPAQPQQPPITSPATAAALAQPQAGTAGSTPAGMDV